MSSDVLESAPFDPRIQHPNLRGFDLWGYTNPEVMGTLAAQYDLDSPTRTWATLETALSLSWEAANALVGEDYANPYQRLVDYTPEMLIRRLAARILAPLFGPFAPEITERGLL